MPSWVVSEDVSGGPLMRRATRADLPRVVELLAQLSFDGEQREELGPPLPQRYYDAFSAIERDPNNDVIVAELEGAIVGTLQLTIISNLRRGGIRIAEVESVVVDERMRGMGIGEAMMRWAADEARRRGCAQVQLTSNKQRHDAHRFYQRLGYLPSHEGLRLTLKSDT